MPLFMFANWDTWNDRLANSTASSFTTVADIVGDHELRNLMARIVENVVTTSTYGERQCAQLA
eukprot:6052595-Prorocentrum_lima.AAC.1